MMEKVVEKEGV